MERCMLHCNLLLLYILLLYLLFYTCVYTFIIRIHILSFMIIIIHDCIHHPLMQCRASNYAQQLRAHYHRMMMMMVVALLQSISSYVTITMIIIVTIIIILQKCYWYILQNVMKRHTKQRNEQHCNILININKSYVWSVGLISILLFIALLFIYIHYYHHKCCYIFLQ